MDFDISWPQILNNLLHLAIAYILALPIAYNRERSTTSAGLRTFPLVAVASCGYTLIGILTFTDINAQARVVQGLITGIGFIGAGAILKGSGGVQGTATAASIWNTGLIGVAVAFNHFEIAILISVINFLTLRYVDRVKKVVRKDQDESDQSA